MVLALKDPTKERKIITKNISFFCLLFEFIVLLTAAFIMQSLNMFQSRIIFLWSGMGAQLCVQTAKKTALFVFESFPVSDDSHCKKSGMAAIANRCHMRRLLNINNICPNPTF